MHACIHIFMLELQVYICCDVLKYTIKWKYRGDHDIDLNGYSYRGILKQIR
jgi:hypothetical protein